MRTALRSFSIPSGKVQACEYRLPMLFCRVSLSNECLPKITSRALYNVRKLRIDMDKRICNSVTNWHLSSFLFHSKLHSSSRGRGNFLFVLHSFYLVNGGHRQASIVFHSVACLSGGIAMLYRTSPSTSLCLLVLGVILSISATSFAQSTSTLRGTVTDQSGAVVPNAKVTARNQATGIERSTQTD